LRTSVWLAPGRYELTVTFAALRATTLLVVGNEEGPVARLELR
jgi:hypothetical protein